MRLDLTSGVVAEVNIIVGSEQIFEIFADRNPNLEALDRELITLAKEQFALLDGGPVVPAQATSCTD